MPEFRQLVSDGEWRSDVSVKLGLSGLSALGTIVLTDAVAGLPAWSMGIPAVLMVLAATIAPDVEWQHAQGQAGGDP